MEQVKILNCSLDNITRDWLLDKLRYGGSVFTLNVDHLMKLQEQADFYQAYASATYRVCDSQILKFTSQVLGQPLREKISGSDFLPAYIHYYRNDPDVRLFLLGAAEGVADTVRQHVNQLYGREMVVDAIHHPMVLKPMRSNASKLLIGLTARKLRPLWWDWGHPNRRFGFTRIGVN